MTPEQAQVSQALIESAMQRHDHLLWAVTGAGKTEMLFPVIAHALAANQRVVIASPRIDVILELAPRLQAAFAHLPIAVYYGDSGEQPESQLVLATTHQLLRFYQAFDLTIVDEVDAFPFAANPMLAFAVKQASKGAVIYLTATPSQELIKRVQTKTLAVSYLPRRFHGAPLPVPKIAFGRHFQRVPAKVRRVLLETVASGRQVLVFVPQVDWLPVIERLVAKLGLSVASVHAQDPERATKVQNFRHHVWQCLVTTTILERGVTIYRCGVIVLQADSALFSAAALIQMAGRAGRSADSPDDPVWFFASHYTRSLATATSQIALMNRRGQHALSTV
ncbi:comF operon protein 1 [Lacticaseibacillus brantae DSM 23927]|uniref:ComF operon protein 1 n=1 Tax=Lacticaseibacillus brantae DSM 23927 TaxID=1423727 RepID=A0A0R2AZX4_9LACO|nr:comF operon protein 1 [Lacticaseibacillus brantae DSM 23927]